MQVSSGLKSFKLNNSNPTIAPAASFTAKSPANRAVMNFASAEATLIPEHLSLTAARQIMSTLKLDVCLVVNAYQAVVGVINLATIQGEKVMIAANQLSVPVDELEVGQLMQSIESIPCVNASELERYRVENVVTLLSQQSSRYMLVMDAITGQVQGLISAGHISRTLNQPVQTGLSLSSFSDIVQAVPHPV